MTSRLGSLAIGLSLSTALCAPAFAKKKPAAAKVVQASEQTQRAVAELAGKFQWGATPEDVQKVVAEEIAARFDDKIKKESSPFKQDSLRREMADQMKKFRDSYIKFDGQSTGWDVSIIDREFGQKNEEAMMVMWEKDQRRFLFFYQGTLWKQFIAFNAEHPAFAGKTFDDFANTIQRRYGPAQMTFRKLKTSDEQTLDHLEWPPAGDFTLWAVDLTQFYGNYCLSLMQTSRRETIDRTRALNSPRKGGEGGLVDAVLKPNQTKGNQNADIIDEITGRGMDTGPSTSAEVKPAATKGKGKGKGEKKKDDAPVEEKTADPLEGSGM